jgi:hypothetical protein
MKAIEEWIDEVNVKAQVILIAFPGAINQSGSGPPTTQTDTFQIMSINCGNVYDSEVPCDCTLPYSCVLHYYCVPQYY